MRRQGPCARQMHGVERSDDGVFGRMEADPAGGHVHVLCHQAHPSPQQRVCDQHAPDLLEHQLWLFAA